MDRRLPVPFEGQVQCPNPPCGGYRVETRTSPAIRHEPLAKGYTYIRGALVAAAIFGLPALSALKAGDKVKPLGVVLLGGIAIIIAVFVVRYWLRGNNFEPWTEPGRYEHDCAICGYRWGHSQDHPDPPWTGQKGGTLLAMGSRQLEMETEARHQAALAAFLAWQQSQLRGK